MGNKGNVSVARCPECGDSYIVDNTGWLDHISECGICKFRYSTIRNSFRTFDFVYKALKNCKGG